MRVLIDTNVILDVLQNRQPFFEDAVQAFCGKRYHVSYIITRNTKDYKLSPVKAIGPVDFSILLGI